MNRSDYPFGLAIFLQLICLFLMVASILNIGSTAFYRFFLALSSFTLAMIIQCNKNSYLKF